MRLEYGGGLVIPNDPYEGIGVIVEMPSRRNDYCYKTHQGLCLKPALAHELEYIPASDGLVKTLFECWQWGHGLGPHKYFCEGVDDPAFLSSRSMVAWMRNNFSAPDHYPYCNGRQWVLHANIGEWDPEVYRKGHYIDPISNKPETWTGAAK